MCDVLIRPDELMVGDSDDDGGYKLMVDDDTDGGYMY